MSDRLTEERRNPFIAGRPSRDRIFYANAAHFAFNEDQEAVIDFKLVMPEDFTLAADLKTERDQEFAEGQAFVNLRNVPIEARVYMPFNQFLAFCRGMAGVWERFRGQSDIESRIGGEETPGEQESRDE